MRRFSTFAAVLMVAFLVRIDSVSIMPLAAQDRVATVIAEAQKAMGGADKVKGIKTLIAEGPYRRSMGGRDMEGTRIVTLARPDKMHQLEEIAMGGMVGGPRIERTSVLNGNQAWDDTANRGGMGGGMQIVMRGPGEGPGPGGAPQMTPEQLNEARVRRMRVQMFRLTAAMLADAGTPWTDAGVAESPDGKADILEAKEETGRTLRLFIDQATHLPLMVQYQDPKPMVMIAGGPGGPGGPGGRGPGGPGGGAAMMTPEEAQKRAEELRKNPPPLGNFAMHLGEFKKVDGLMLPHRFEVAIDGEPNEEWTVEKYRVNPNVKADLFEKK
jgi:hypothetical protein